MGWQTGALVNGLRACAWMAARTAALKNMLSGVPAAAIMATSTLFGENEQ